MYENITNKFVAFIMKILQILLTISALCLTFNVQAWWGTRDNNHQYYANDNRWNNYWGNDTSNNAMADMVNDIDLNMDVDMKFKVKARGDGRHDSKYDGYYDGYNNWGNNWDNRYYNRNYNGYGYQHYRNPYYNYQPAPGTPYRVR